MPKPRRGEPPTQPHDALVKWTFSQREHAAGLLKAALPPEVVAAVDWGTLRVEQEATPAAPRRRAAPRKRAPGA